MQDFIDIWNGKYLDFDGNSGCQCVDVAKAWEYYLGLEVLKGNAINLKDTKSSDYEWMDYNDAPQEGDILIWDIGEYGHVSICISATQNTVEVFEQNNPIGSPCHIGTHYYSGLLGWLRPRKEDMSQKYFKILCMLLVTFFWKFTHDNKNPDMVSISKDVDDMEANTLETTYNKIVKWLNKE